MTQATSGNAVQSRSITKSDGTLVLSLETVPIPQPKDDELLVRIEASPINPSDLGLLFGAADLRPCVRRRARPLPALVT